MAYYNKAIVGGIVSLALAGLSLFGITRDMTVETAIYTALTGLSTALTVYLAKNKVR